MLEKVKKYIVYFMLYSIIGWIYEVFLEVVIYKWGFSNRGVLYGPYCVIYGFASLIFIITLSKLKKCKIKMGKISITPILIFLGIILISTIIELIGSYIMELITEDWMWDYSNYAFNFQGRIALNPSLRFGIGGMVFLYVFQPIFEKFTTQISSKFLNIISITIVVVLLLDCYFVFFIY